MNGAELVVKRLLDVGVDRIFALCGNGLAPFLDACVTFGLRVIDVRNEQSAAYMADTWGRMTGSLGVVAVSSGPGHTNALTGLANSHWDGGPMLLISGCSEQQTRGLDDFQELDQVAMARPVCKYARMVHQVEMLETTLLSAISAALRSRPGPAHLTIPRDIFQADVSEQSTVRLPAPDVACGQDADTDEIARSVDILRSAQRPFILVGSGAFYADAWEPLRDLCTLTDIPVLSHIWDRGCVQEAIPQYVGVSNDALNGSMSALAVADALLVIGARLDYRVGFGRPPVLSPDARIIRVSADPSEVVRSRIPDVALVGNPRRVLRRMVAMAKEGPDWSNEEWLANVRARKRRRRLEFEDLARGDVWPVPGLRICREIKRFLDSEVTFLLDGGNIGRWAHLDLFDRHPSHWFTCGASGVVGWGIPGAISARMARPDHPLLLLSGDGAAGFVFMDVETALRFETPYVAVIAHDGAWGIVADAQPEDRRIASRLGEIRFDRVAEALGARGVYIDDPSALGPAIEEGLALNTVTVIHVPTQLGGIDAYDHRRR